MPLLQHWATLPEAELLARLRSLQTAARLICGPRAGPLIVALKCAEAGIPGALQDADAELAALPTLTLRRLLSSLAETVGR
jgi:hypothetical protein